MFLYWRKRGAYQLEALPGALAELELGAVERFSWSSSLDIIEDLGGRCGPTSPGGLLRGSDTWATWPPPHPACVTVGPVLSGAVEARAPPSTAVGGGQGPGDPGDHRRGKGWPGSVGPMPGLGAGQWEQRTAGTGLAVEPGLSICPPPPSSRPGSGMNPSGMFASRAPGHGSYLLLPHMDEEKPHREKMEHLKRQDRWWRTLSLGGGGR